MATRLNPYLTFRDTAREALEHYRSVLGGELTLSTFGELGGVEDASERDKIMHGQLETPAGFTLMASDTPAAMEVVPGTDRWISLSGGGEDDAELRGYWDGLLEGGTVVEPLTTAPWGAAFGMLVDRFGVRWMVNIEAPAA